MAAVSDTWQVNVTFFISGSSRFAIDGAARVRNLAWCLNRDGFEHRVIVASDQRL
jgi:hypothetical protein